LKLGLRVNAKPTSGCSIASHLVSASIPAARPAWHGTALCASSTARAVSYTKAHCNSPAHSEPVPSPSGAPAARRQHPRSRMWRRLDMNPPSADPPSATSAARSTLPGSVVAAFNGPSNSRLVALQCCSARAAMSHPFLKHSRRPNSHTSSASASLLLLC
jgi:hypothetical protein